MAVVREMTGSDLFHDLKSRDRDNFTYEGCVALVEWLDELSDETNVPVIYDPIGFCVEYSEYGSLCELQADYDNIETIEDLRDETFVIEFGNGQLIVQDW